LTPEVERVVLFEVVWRVVLLKGFLPVLCGSLLLAPSTRLREMRKMTTAKIKIQVLFILSLGF